MDTVRNTVDDIDPASPDMYYTPTIPMVLV